jgi:bacteriocin biosynthesis cyclodehydratase domain-containing protein
MELREASSTRKGPPPDARLWVSPAASGAALGEDRALVWIGGFRQVIQGRSARVVPKLLEQLRDGEMARAAAVAVAESEGCSIEEATRVLEVLWERGVVDEVDPGDTGAASASSEIGAQTRYLALFTSRPHRALAALSSSTVDLFGLPNLAMRLSELLSASGLGAVSVHPAEAPASERLRSRPTTEGRSLAVVLGRSLEDDGMLALNDALVNAGRSFVAATVSGGSARIGPAVLPHETACLRCLFEVERRLVAPLPEGIRLPGAPPTATEPVALLDLVAAVLALEVMKSSTGLFVPSLANRRLFVEPASLAFEYEVLVKLPRCPSCGRAATHAEIEAFDTMVTAPPSAAASEA